MPPRFEGLKMIFIITASEGLTFSYHSGGGAVVEASTPEEALARVRAEVEKDRGKYDDFNTLENLVIEVFDPTKVYVFPDAGCC
jgi:hypothetical protein